MIDNKPNKPTKRKRFYVWYMVWWCKGLGVDDSEQEVASSTMSAVSLSRNDPGQVVQTRASVAE